MLEKKNMQIEESLIVSFVILHFGDWKVTDNCVQSILRMEKQEQIRIVIVDNDIKKPIAERMTLQERYEANAAIHVIQILENGGFSYANNIGYSYAREQQNASFILVLNNDIEFLQVDFIERLEQAYLNNPCHILAPDIVKASTKEHQNPMDTRIRTKEEAEYTIRMNRIALNWYPVLYPALYLQNKYNEKKQLQQKQKNEEYYNKVQKNIVPFGAGLIFTPKFVRTERKAFDPETNFYYEEYILALRCQRKGYEIVYDPELKLLHESGAATKTSHMNEIRRMKFIIEKTEESCKRYLQFMCFKNKFADKKIIEKKNERNQ